MPRPSTSPKLKPVSKAVSQSTKRLARPARVKAKPSPAPKPSPDETEEPVFFQVADASGQVDSGCLPFCPTSPKKGQRASPGVVWSALAGLCQSNQLKTDAPFGLLPGGFAQRTGVAVQTFAKGIQANPGRDLYLFNDSPADEALFANGLSRGFIEKPGLADVAAAFYELLGESGDRALGANASSEFSMAPYMAASKPFYVAWQAYLAEAVGKASKWPAVKRSLLESVFEQTPHLEGQTGWDLLLASTLPVFLSTPQGRTFRALKISLPQREAELNAHLRSLRQMKDAAIRGRAQWLLGCWLSYRNLYLLQVNGKAWCERHLRRLTAGVATSLSAVPAGSLQGLDNSGQPSRSKAK